MKRIDTYTSILLFFIACQCAFAQTWPPETFTWYYNDSVVTPELEAKAKSGDPIALNDMALATSRAGRTADEGEKKSRKWYVKAVEAGAPRAMLLHIVTSRKVAKDKALRKEYLDRIYRSSDGDAICKAAEFMRTPFPYFLEPEKGYMRKFYLRAAHLGNKLAQRVIAEDFVFGGGPYGVKINIDSAYHYLKESGTYDVREFRIWATELYPFRGDSTDMKAYRPEDAAAIFRYVIADHKPGDGEDFLAQWWLGDLYYDILYKWDDAFACYKAMAENFTLGNGNYVNSLRGYAYERMARCYRFGRGVEEDQEEADRLLRIARELGCENAEDLAKRLNMLK